MLEQENMSRDMDICHLQDIYPKNMRKNVWILLQNQEYMLQKVVHETA